MVIFFDLVKGTATIVVGIVNHLVNLVLLLLLKAVTTTTTTRII
jgi:hypothetical protein